VQRSFRILPQPRLDCLCIAQYQLRVHTRMGDRREPLQQA
jgi:hypothetical protein